MEWFIAFKYLHIVAMFFAVALALSGEMVLRRVAGGHDVRAIRATVARVKPLSGKFAPMLFMTGVAFGVAAALAGQFDLLRPWLIMSYLAFVAAVLMGVTVTDPWVARLEREAAESPDETASDALRAVVADPRAKVAAWATFGLIALLVFLMVVKPLG
jgi:hypothetical protein